MKNKQSNLHKILVIQTAFIGDVILASALLEKLHQYYPEAQIDFLLRKGNDGLFANHPFINQLVVLNKQEGKYKNQLKLIKQIRNEKYDLLINLHRFLSSGLISAFSGARQKIGFDKNPLSFTFSKTFSHVIDEENGSSHEVERNQTLIAEITDNKPAFPKLYPSQDAFEKIKKWQTKPYVCIAPASVWFTKQFPANEWIQLIKAFPEKINIYLLGAPSDAELCNQLIEKSERQHIESLAGKLTLLDSAALMKGAQLNYVNDSAPLHLCSAMSAPVCAVFCSTIPNFGFGPFTSSFNKIVEYTEQLECRPCGLHGHKACPEGHFKCALGITTNQLLNVYWEAINYTPTA